MRLTPFRYKTATDKSGSFAHFKLHLWSVEMYLGGFIAERSTGQVLP
jgi:hypothetical protein